MNLLKKNKIRDFRAYDRAAIKFRGMDADINFDLNDYEEDMKQVEVGCVTCVHSMDDCCNSVNFILHPNYNLIGVQMMNLTKEEFVQVLRRQSNGFARGNSKYRGATLQKCDRWEPRTGQFLGKK